MLNLFRPKTPSFPSPTPWPGGLSGHARLGVTFIPIEGEHFSGSSHEVQANGNVLIKGLQVLKFGEFNQEPGHGKFSLTPEMADQMIGNFRSRGEEVFLTIGHPDKLDGAPAAAWVKSLSKRKNGLFADVLVLAETADRIRRGEYRYFSPTINFSAKDETGGEIGAQLVSGAFTNFPFLEGMKPLELAIREPEQDQEDFMDPTAKKQFMLDVAKAAQEAVTEGLAELSKKLETVESKLQTLEKAKSPAPGDPDQKKALEASGAHQDKNALTLAAIQERNDDLQKQVAALSRGVASRDARRLIDQGIDEGKLLKKQFPDYESDPLKALEASSWGKGRDPRDAVAALAQHLAETEPIVDMSRKAKSGGEGTPKAGGFGDPKDKDTIELAQRIGVTPEELAEFSSPEFLRSVGIVEED